MFVSHGDHWSIFPGKHRHPVPNHRHFKLLPPVFREPVAGELSPLPRFITTLRKKLCKIRSPCPLCVVLSQVLQTQLQAANVATQIQQLQGGVSTSTATLPLTSSTTPTTQLPPPPSSSSSSSLLNTQFTSGDLLSQLRQQQQLGPVETQTATGDQPEQQSAVTSLLTAQLATALGIDTAASSPSTTGVTGKVR